MAKWSLPETFRERALQLRGAGDKEKWALGDLISEVVSEAPRGKKTTALIDCALVAGIGRAQAYKYRQVAETFPGATRATLEGLTLDGLAECARAPEPVRVAEWAIASADDYGGWPAPVDIIRRKVTALLGKPERPPLEEITSLLTRAANAMNTALTLYGQHFPDRDVLALEAALTALEQQQAGKA